MNTNQELIKNFIIDYNKYPIIQTYIQQENTRMIWIAGSRSLPLSWDKDSDLDIICWNRGHSLFKSAYYHISYKNVLIHWDYNDLIDTINFNLPYHGQRNKWFIGGLITFSFKPIILYIHPAYKNFYKILVQHTRDLLIIGLALGFQSCWSFASFNPKYFMIFNDKLVVYCLIGSYLLNNQEIDWNLVYRFKRLHFNELNETEQKEVKDQIISIYLYFKNCPFNLAHKELEISNILTEEYLKAEKQIIDMERKNVSI